jgi:hypothetical protein
VTEERVIVYLYEATPDKKPEDTQRSFLKDRDD